MLPIALPQLYLRKIRSIIMKYVRQNKKPRIQFSILCKGKAQGGITAQDIKRYYYAVILTKMIEWTKMNADKDLTYFCTFLWFTVIGSLCGDSFFF